MSDPLKGLDDFEREVSGMLAGLSPAGRAKLMRRVARDWRKAQEARIKGQKNTDGSAYVPRKRQPLRAKGGKSKRSLRAKPMFQRLRTRRHLRSGADANEAWVGFVGSKVLMRIAEVHQEGMKDKPAPGAKPVEYPRRELLGLSDDDREHILDLVIKHMEA